jgi:hypothetical protein
VKARGKNVAEAYAVLRLERYRQLVSYVIALEMVIVQGTGSVLCDPDELKKFVAYMASAPEGAHLLPVFGEFTTPEEVEVLGDGTEVPAGAESTPCQGCGRVHTAQDEADGIAFLAAILGLDPTELMGDSGPEAAAGEVYGDNGEDRAVYGAEGDDAEPSPGDEEAELESASEELAELEELLKGADDAALTVGE